MGKEVHIQLLENRRNSKAKQIHVIEMVDNLQSKTESPETIPEGIKSLQYLALPASAHGGNHYRKQVQERSQQVRQL